MVDENGPLQFEPGPEPTPGTVQPLAGAYQILADWLGSTPDEVEQALDFANTENTAWGEVGGRPTQIHIRNIDTSSPKTGIAARVEAIDPEGHIVFTKIVGRLAKGEIASRLDRNWL